MFLNPFSSQTLSGVEPARAATSEIGALQLALEQGQLPAGFPLALWRVQSERYRQYWYWFRGDALLEERGKTKDGRVVYRYPLKINPVRNFARKHAALLFGEAPDTPSSLVRPLVRPKMVLGERPSATDRKQAQFAEYFLNEVWSSSNGRSLQQENGLLSQFLGGCVFQVVYQPWRKDLIIPITVKNVPPDFFLPIWSPDNYWDLLEAFIVYRIPAAAAKQQWNIETATLPYVLYVEHWTRTTHTILVDGKPLVATYPDGTTVTYDKRENPFGFVPFVYIPRFREGDYYGSSFVPDIEGLAIELNARAADEGDAVRKNVHRKWFGRNITASPKQRDLDEFTPFIDLGVENPAMKNPPELWTEDAPDINSQVRLFNNYLWAQMARDGGLGPIAFGEDEGSQRSALTLAVRMWPSTTMAKMQRTFWTDGLNQINRYILRIAAFHGVTINRQRITPDFLVRYELGQDWPPMIPRDREAEIREIIARLQTNSLSLEKALQMFGDIPDVQEEIDRIKGWITFNADLNTKPANNPAATGLPPEPGEQDE